MLTKISENKVFGGTHRQYQHSSSCNRCDMRFAIYLPPQYNASPKVPVLYWLSGLTCTDENFMQKAAAFRVAAELGMAIVAPDTSPRGEQVPNNDAYDLGQGAGFYLNATQTPWADHYHMYSYVTQELPQLIRDNFAVSDKQSIAGHSMGGLGALVVGLRNQESYQSISAFSPICNPIDCPWGQKAFSNYLGEDTSTWSQYDPCELLKNSSTTLPILIDQGDADTFLGEQLKPAAIEKVAKQKGHLLSLRMQQGYDHSYFFISSFIEEHLRFHALHLGI